MLLYCQLYGRCCEGGRSSNKAPSGVSAGSHREKRIPLSLFDTCHALSPSSAAVETSTAEAAA